MSQEHQESGHGAIIWWFRAQPPDEENVQLALRNPTDESVLAKVERKPAELPKVAAPAPQKPAFRHVTIIRGVKVDKFQVWL